MDGVTLIIALVIAGAVAAGLVVAAILWRRQQQETKQPAPASPTIVVRAAMPTPAPVKAPPLWTIEQFSDEQVVTLNGNIDDQARFGKLVGQLHGHVVFDLVAVRKLSSIGVSHWINFLRAIPEEVTYSFRRCSHSFCSCASCVNGVLGRGDVASFMAPYLCEECEHEFTIELNLDPTTTRPPRSMDCPECQGLSMLEELTERYRSFMEIARGGYIARPETA